jgi:bifunctional non-homologous end joining protein LigD
VAKRAKSRVQLAEGAKPAEMPGFIKPQLATLKSKAPTGDTWLHEIKYDGYRVQLHARDERVAAYTRNGLDWTKRFSTIARAFDIPVQAIVDGEAVVIKDGRTNFSELQAALGGRQAGPHRVLRLRLAVPRRLRPSRRAADRAQAAAQGAV